MKKTTFRLLGLFLVMFAMNQPAQAGSGFLSWLEGLINSGATGNMYYSKLTAKAIGDGKVYVHWPVGGEEEPSAEELENIGAVEYTEESPEDNTARAKVSWGTSETSANHNYMLYVEPHTGFEIDGIYTDENCTTAYNSSSTYDGDGYKGYSVVITTSADNRTAPQSLTLYARFALNVAINGRGYSTLYYSKYNFKVPTGVTATTYKLGEGSGKLEVSTTYSAGQVIPAGEAVVLQGTANTTYKFIPVTGTYTKDGANVLRGTDEAATTTGGEEYFALSYNNTKGVVGFYWMATDGAAFECPAHKAYLALSSASGVKGFDLNGNDDATGIDNIDAEANDEAIYNLAGQRVGKMQKGINIVNGKKILKK